MFKSYKYRIYPNKEQEEQIQKTFGCCRFVYNQSLAYRKDKYEKEKKSLSRIDCNNWKNQFLKKEYQWLKEVDKWALDNAIINMDNAYQKFFKEHAGYPKFKSKHNHYKSYKTNYINGNIEVSFDNNKIKLPKLKWVKAKVHRKFLGKIKSATISQVPSGKYFISILVDCEHYFPQEVEGKIGIDMGLEVYCSLSTGIKIPNPRFIKQYEDKLAYEQKKLSRKTKGSKRYEKQRIKVAKVYEKISNCRKDFLHKLSNIITNENQVIIMETLSSKEVQQNRQLSKSVSDVSWYEFGRQLEYKSNWKGRVFHRIDRWFPSSQICSSCGYNDGKHTLDIREWTCPNCGREHDRDINASINILHEGIRELGL